MRLSGNRIKSLWSYTVEELARCVGCHRNTVRQWIKLGLPTIDQRRPQIILGSDAKAFLNARRAARKQKCDSNEMFCLKCRRPAQPVPNSVRCTVASPGVGALAGVCTKCGGKMNRRVGRTSLDKLSGEMNAAFRRASMHLVDTESHRLNSGFEKAS